MMKVISKAISLANSAPLTQPDLLIRARDWADELCQVIPSYKLADSVRRAFELHESTFPLNAHDIKAGYDSLENEAAMRRAEEEQKFRARLREQPIDHYPKCLRCRDTGVEAIYGAGNAYLGHRPGCQHDPVSNLHPLYTEEQRLTAIGDQMMEEAAAGKVLNVEEMIRRAGGVLKSLWK